MATTTPASTTTKSNPRMGRWIGIGVLVLIIFYVAGAYNKMVKADEVVNQKWGDVESTYKRRMDLIDNLVNTVKGAADFEKSTFTEVTEARAKATSINIDPSTATPEQLAAFNQAQGAVSSSLSRLLLVVENYPTLTATQNFKELQSQLEGTENRINVARIDYNAAVKDFNTRVRSFPGNLIAGIFGMEKRNTFDAPEEAETAPKVDFSDNK